MDIYYEASVGGGIPIIRSFKVGYSANQIQSLYGILNGTTNYILTKIQEDGKEFNVALKEAQELGFAEADPTMDVNGLDAAYKLVILAAVAFKVDIQVDSVHYEGIEEICLTDMKYANELGYTIKLIASGNMVDEKKMSFQVGPLFVPLDHPLATVRNEFNAIFSVGNAVGESMIYGKGAGSFPTGSAVVSDLMDIAFDIDHRLPGKRNLEDHLNGADVQLAEESRRQFYVRLNLVDEVGALEKVMTVLGERGISVLKIIQKEVKGGVAEVVLITHDVQVGDMDSAIELIKKNQNVKDVPSYYKVGLFVPQGVGPLQ